MLTPFDSPHITLVATKFYIDSLFQEKMINLSIALFPTNLKAAVKQCRAGDTKQEMRKPQLLSESCLQVTFGQSFNLSRLLFFHPLHEGLRLEDDSTAIVPFQTERTFRKQIK